MLKYDGAADVMNSRCNILPVQKEVIIYSSCVLRKEMGREVMIYSSYVLQINAHCVLPYMAVELCAQEHTVRLQVFA